ncbi:hypothetical protein Ddc_18768 [Ditylenchus destructor]|nr:hypothetical protein Ddc_18768 [Ditylenchus destructor]
MSIPVLYFGLQRDIFALFNRPELSRISETNRRVNAIIEKHFVSSPRLTIDYLHYKNGVWKWSDDVDFNESEDKLEAAASPMSDSQIAQLPTSKFLRFKELKFIFYKGCPLEVLKAHQHLWEDSRLRIVAMDFWCSSELASIVNTSHDLLLLVPGAFDVLPQLIRGNINHVAVLDLGFTPDSSNAVVASTNVDSIVNYTKQLPLDDINNFLFNNACKNDQCSPFHLNITTTYMPTYWQEIVDSIKQKFLKAPDPSEFCFVISGQFNWPQAHDWTLRHGHSKKELRFRISDLFFRLYCTNIV